jgi:hypothetical protein
MILLFIALSAVEIYLIVNLIFRLADEPIGRRNEELEK